MLRMLFVFVVLLWLYELSGRYLPSWFYATVLAVGLSIIVFKTFDIYTHHKHNTFWDKQKR